MPNRYVRESAIESETVDRLSWAGEVFWRRLINKVDDFGRFTANPELLRAALFPLRLNKVSAADIGKMILECEQSGLISTWKGEDGKAYLVMHKWERGRAKESRYPKPPTDANICFHVSANVPDSDADSDNDTDFDKALPENWESWMGNAEFLEAWKAWSKARKQKPTELQFKKLERLSNGNLQTAMAIVRESAENGWKGLFPLKTNVVAFRNQNQTANPNSHIKKIEL